MTAFASRDALDAFARAIGASGPVAVEGGRTRWSLGGAPAQGTRLVRAPAGVVEHRLEEMTVRVLAGTSVAALHALLAEAGQRSALPERGGTVGGALAVGENALSSLRRGRVRDALLEVTYVSGDGRLVTGGAPTVKNVSGFDLPRLMVGALGTLGLIAEVVLRTQPLPSTSRWLVAADADPFAVKDAARSASCVLYDGERTYVELEGHEVDVEADLGILGHLARFGAASGPPPLPPRRWSLSPGDLRRLDPTATGPFVASIGVGLVFASLARPAPAVAEGVRALSRAMKAAFDPEGRLNPGRDPLQGS